MTITVLTGNQSVSVPFTQGQTILDALRAFGGIGPAAPCGGRGTCKKCRVTLLLPEGEKDVLACQTPAEEGITLKIPQEGELTVALGNPMQVETACKTGYGIACDIGTTTVVCHLVNFKTGEVVGTLGRGNQQRAFGADVISRIQASMEGKLPEMTRCIRRQLSQMILELGKNAGVSMEEITSMTVAANTTMCHILTGLSPESMGHAPYEPQSRFGTWYRAEDLELPISGEIYVIPAAGAYVGGDITADIFAAGLQEREAPALLIDVGTNGEMALGCGNRFLCCSTAAGPAFEGAQITCGMTAAPGAVSEVRWENGIEIKTVGGGEATGICGSGLIDALAVMLDAEAMDETGRMLDPEEDDIPEALAPYLRLYQEEPAFYLTEKIFVTQGDVRKVQLGKGAIAAGVQVLRDHWQGEEIGELLLAGGFGSFIRPESAARIGLIPADLLPKTKAIGNGAARGAVLTLCDPEGTNIVENIRENMRVLELSGLQAFRDAYMEQMLFPGEVP